MAGAPLARRRVLAGAAAAVTGLVLAACGRKGPPIAPELVQPLPPTGLVASRTPEGVKVGWRRPTRTSGGRSLDDLDRFLVERAQGDGPFALVHTLVVEDRERFRPASRFEWIDGDADPSERWCYRVLAVTLDGYRSPPAGPVEILPGGGAAAQTPADAGP